MIAILSAICDNREKCSLNRTPGTLVAVSLNSPPLACPTLRSKVSICDGPPAIQRMIKCCWPLLLANRFESGMAQLHRVAPKPSPSVDIPCSHLRRWSISQYLHGSWSSVRISPSVYEIRFSKSKELLAKKQRAHSLYRESHTTDTMNRLTIGHCQGSPGTPFG